MIVTRRPGIEPKCTKHYTAMALAEFGANGLTVKAYKCNNQDCTQVYNFPAGYFDIVNDHPVLQKDQQKCPTCGLPMYLDAVNTNLTETWRCAQTKCDQLA